MTFLRFHGLSGIFKGMAFSSLGLYTIISVGSDFLLIVLVKRLLLGQPLQERETPTFLRDSNSGLAEELKKKTINTTNPRDKGVLQHKQPTGILCALRLGLCTLVRGTPADQRLFSLVVSCFNFAPLFTASFRQTNR